MRKGLPLSRFALPVARGVEQCRETVAHFLCENTVDARGGTSGDLELHLRVAPLSQGMTLGVLRWTGGADIRACNSGDLYDFVTLLGGRGRFTVAGREVDHVPGKRGVVVAPERPSRAVTDRAITALCVTVDRSLAESHFNALAGVELSDGLVFDAEMPLSGRSAFLWRLVRQVADEINQQPGALDSALVLERLSETLLTGFLYAQPHNGSHLLRNRVRDPGPHYVREAEEYIEAHCEEKITARRLAEVTGVSVSVLYEGFHRHRDYTPIRFLRHVRLRRARDQLLAAAPGCSVTRVALKWGFLNLGRFSEEYRRQFGENPSETLKRARC